jgi:hypothetical protein
MKITPNPILGPFWAVIEPFQTVPSHSRAVLSPYKIILGHFKAISGRFWVNSGPLKLFQAVLNHIEIVLGHLRLFGAVVWSFWAVSDVLRGRFASIQGSFVRSGRFGPFPIISGHTEVVLRLS